MTFDPKNPFSKPALTGLKTRPFERNLALTRMGLGAGAQIAAHSVANLFRGSGSRTGANRGLYREQARFLADRLGQLKGSVMKAGQMLSLYGQYFLPPEAVQALSVLQDDTVPVRWRMILPTLERTLGRARLSELEIDETAMAAASLGQVHRARRKRDGLELCIKVQYPGVADTIESDLRTLSRLLTVSKLAPKGLDLTPVLAELRDMLRREVDYFAEARFTELFAKRLAGDPRFVVPGVLGEYCGAQVLATSYERGVGVREASVQALSQTRRDRLGVAFFDLFVTEFFDWGVVQTDPHFGNYLVRLGQGGEDDRLVLLDFGATREYPSAFIDAYAGLVLGAALRDRARLIEGARGIGVMRGDFPESVLDAFAMMCERIVEPFSDRSLPDVDASRFNDRGEYRFGATDLPLRAGQIAAKNALSLYFRVPPREIVFLHRRILGVLVTLSALRCELDLRQPLITVLEKRLRTAFHG